MLEVFRKRYIIKKEKCQGHIQKIMGTALREYKREKGGMKLSDRLTLGGKNRITIIIIEQ